MLRINCRLTRRFTLGTLTALLSATLAAGCTSGSGADHSKSGPALSAAKNDMNPQPRSAIKKGGTLQWAIAETIPNFNYYNINGALTDTYEMSEALLPTPFHYNAAAQPSVNTDYFTRIAVTSQNPLTITYNINPKAVWSDGQPLSWKDFYGLWRANNGKNSKFQVWGTTGYTQIGSVTEGASMHQVVVKYASYFADWRSLFTPLVPASLTATPDAFNNAWAAAPLVTAGPFQWAGQDKTAETYTFARNPKWWGQPALLDKIIFHTYENPSAAVQAFQTGQVDYDELVPDRSIYTAAKQTSGVSVRTAGSAVFRMFTFNKRDSLLSDPAVRRALVLGIDRSRMAALLSVPFGGSAQPLQNHIFMPNQVGYTKDCGQLCTYDPAAAQKLLQSDGWKRSGSGYFSKNGKQLELTITVQSGRTNSANEAEIAQASLKNAGIKLNIQTVPDNDFFPKYVIPGHFQLATWTWNGVPFPVSGSLSLYINDPKNIQQNYGMGGNAEVNTLLNKAVQATSTVSENSLAAQADKAIWTDASWLPLYQLPQDNAVRSSIANLGAFGFADIRFQDIGFMKN